MLLKNLPKEAKRSLSGLVLSLSNIEEQSLKLPEEDRHLLDPPDDLPTSKLYDIFHVIQLDRTPVQARTLYSRLIEKYYDLDRDLRVSKYFVLYRIFLKIFYTILHTFSVWTEQKSGIEHQFSWIGDS